MVHLIRKVLESYNYYFHEAKGMFGAAKRFPSRRFLTNFYARSDPRSENFLFMRNPPLLITIILGGYLLMIVYGPRIMMARKPFELNTILLVYNFSQVVLNTALCVYVSKATFNFPLEIPAAYECFYF
jgi:GNS1/SUR4 family